MSKGYYIKKDQRDGLTLNVKKEQFIQYLQGIQGEWIRFKIYERDKPAGNGLAFNMELIERKGEVPGQSGRETLATKQPNPNPTGKVD